MRATLDQLTSLRFFAAFAIIFHHLAGVMWFEAGAFKPYPLDSAVAFFFVLSGFVLHYSYGTRMGQIGWLRFAIQRFMRIWPAHVAVLILCSLWLIIPDIRFHLERQSMVQTLQVVFLLQAWSQEPIVFWGLNGPSWSISTELVFYLAFPALVLLLSRIKLTSFMLAAGVFTVLWLIFATVVLYDPGNDLSGLALGYISPLARIGEFCLGIALSAFLTPRLKAFRERSIRVRATWVSPIWFWSALECAALVVLVLSLHHVSLLGWYVGQNLGPVAGSWAGASGAMPSFALVIGVFAVGRGVLSVVLCHPLLVWLGTISFAMYLIHQPLILHWNRSVVPFLQNTTLEVIGFALAVLVFSALIHRWVETSGIALGRRLADRVQGPGSP